MSDISLAIAASILACLSVSPCVAACWTEADTTALADEAAAARIELALADAE